MLGFAWDYSLTVGVRSLLSRFRALRNVSNAHGTRCGGSRDRSAVSNFELLQSSTSVPGPKLSIKKCRSVLKIILLYYLSHGRSSVTTYIFIGYYGIGQTCFFHASHCASVCGPAFSCYVSATSELLWLLIILLLYARYNRSPLQ